MSAEFEFIDNGNGDYTLLSGADGIVIDAAHIRWQGDDLSGEVTLTTQGGSNGPLRIDFMKPTSRRDVLASLENAPPQITIALNELCRRIIECERQNTSPVVQLHEVARPS